MKVLYAPATISKWGVYELAIDGPADGNPFLDHTIYAVFNGKNEEKKVYGFYDGEGVYKVRFMPSFEGSYHYSVFFDDSEAADGSFCVTEAESGNHGPMRVMNTYHLVYEDGTPYFSIGTTCYAWVFQKEEIRRQTLTQLKDSAFNKIRFCLTPKHYIHNLVDPVSFPYEGTPVDRSHITEENFFTDDWERDHENDFDYTRLNPKHFQLLDWAIEELGKLGIEADLIIMHPYDCWGFSSMTREQDDEYWRYVIARFSAYRNVWWSFANEWDLMKEKTVEDWERYAKIVFEYDPYSHLRGIHNCKNLYDYSRPWITHCSLQRVDVYKTTDCSEQFRIAYRKPVIWDEIAYEGNIEQGWGNITGQELMRRFWEGVCRGAYVGHGETFIDPDDILWWSHGGVLHGESNERLKFLADIAKTFPIGGLKPYELAWDAPCVISENDNEEQPLFMMTYFGFNRPGFRQWTFPKGASYRVTVVDTWNMTVEDAGTYQGFSHIPLPGKQYIALIARKVS